jgi:phosphoenolpyruvate carboxylase
VGYPPEFLGTGNGLKEVMNKFGKDGVQKLLKFYPSLITDLKFAGKFLHFQNAKKYFNEKTNYILQENIDHLNIILDHEMKPLTEGDELYRTLMETVRPMLKQLIGSGREIISDKKKEMDLINEWLIRMGKIRRSLG